MCAPSVAHRIEPFEQWPTATLPSPPESSIAQDTGLSAFKKSLPGAIRILALDEVSAAGDNATGLATAHGDIEVASISTLEAHTFVLATTHRYAVDEAVRRQGNVSEVSCERGELRAETQKGRWRGWCWCWWW